MSFWYDNLARELEVSSPTEPRTEQEMLTERLEAAEFILEQIVHVLTKSSPLERAKRDFCVAEIRLATNHFMRSWE